MHVYFRTSTHFLSYNSKYTLKDVNKQAKKEKSRDKLTQIDPSSPPGPACLARDRRGDFTVSSLRIGTQLLNNQLILLTLITKQQTSQYAKNRSKYRTKNRDRLLYSIAWPRRARGARGPQFIIPLRPPRTPPRSAMVAAAAATAASVASVARATVAAAV